MIMMVLEERQDHAEYTLPRDDQDSEPLGWIRGHTKIGPVRRVRVTCCLDQYGMEIQVPSMSKNGSYSWIVISRGQTATWMNLGKIKKTLLKTLRW